MVWSPTSLNKKLYELIYACTLQNKSLAYTQSLSLCFCPAKALHSRGAGRDPAVGKHRFQVGFDLWVCVPPPFHCSILPHPLNREIPELSLPLGETVSASCVLLTVDVSGLTPDHFGGLRVKRQASGDFRDVIGSGP